MGITQSIEYQAYSHSLIPIETGLHDHFGPIQIYRMTQPPYECIMSVRQIFVNNDHQCQKHVSLMNNLGQLSHKNLAKVHHCQETEEIQLCIRTRKTHTFYNYYNFTLQQLVQKRKLRSQKFPQAELIYILGCLLNLALYLREYNISIGSYRSNSIYVSPEGHIKLYLLQNSEDQQHNAFYKVIRERHLLEEYTLAPEQLEAINRGEQEITFNIYQSDLFTIAMTVLELLTLDHPRFYYNQDYTAIRIDKVAFDLSSHSGTYTQPFLQLLRNCLHPDPQIRISLELAEEQLLQLRSSSHYPLHCIKFQEQPQGFLGRSTPLKSQFIVNSLQRKLQFPPSISNCISRNENQTLLKVQSFGRPRGRKKSFN